MNDNNGIVDYYNKFIAPYLLGRQPWVKVPKEKFNMKMQIPLYSEEAALGAALFSLVASGKYTTIEDAERIVNYENI